MKKAIVVGGVVVVAALVLLLFLPALLGPGTGSDMEITFYDADGNELGKASTAGGFGLGIRSEGIEGNIYSLKVVVYFKVTTDVEYGWITTGCWLEVVTVAAQTGSAVHTVAEHRLGAVNTDLEGTFYNTYLMSELLPDDKITEAAKLYGWQMTFNGRLETDLGTGATETHSVADTCSIALMLTWEETLTLDSWFGFS